VNDTGYVFDADGPFEAIQEHNAPIRPHVALTKNSHAIAALDAHMHS
jgi:hypothetical protein